MSRWQYELFYGRAERAEDLPWHLPDPPGLLREVLAHRGGRRARALDLGCGAGFHAIHLAQAGYEVTAIDFMPQAVDMAAKEAARAGVDLEILQADVLSWASAHAFDLILDSGCLHSLARRDRGQYRDNLLGWLADEGDFVLVHFEKRHALDWRPVGPRRFEEPAITGLFDPPLHRRGHTVETMATPLPIGPRVQLGTYWFSRSPG